MLIEADKSQICSVSQQARDVEELMAYLQSKSQ